jgi:hypothetical protein
MKIDQEKIDDYKNLGLNLTYSDYYKSTKLSDMTDEFIQSKIEMIINLGVNDNTPFRQAWLYIFTDVKMKRRINKLNKLKNIINEKIL